MSDQEVSTQILTRAAVASLTADLDAGDVLECYLLSRSTQLHGLANSTIKVTKQALGLRYRPPADASIMHAAKNPLELTLEYGPMRAGATLQHESIPRVVRETELSGETAYVSWENEGKVYYTTTISHGYLTANYLASLTGAVLNDLLLTAVDYAEQHRRYQPFAVYEKERLLLRSSSDTDFMNALFKHLANVGVELAPVIHPIQWQVRLQAESVVKVQASVQAEQSVSRSVVAEFYSRLYKCLEAVATSDYSAYDTKSTSTMAPSMMPSTMMPSTTPTLALASSLAPTPITKAGDDGSPAPTPLSPPTAIISTNAPSSSDFYTGNNGTETDNNEDPPRRRVLISDDTQENPPAKETNNRSPESLSAAPSASPVEVQPQVSDSAQAAQAAADAAVAADQADHAGNTEAANAAHAAANAAQKAADVTASQANTMSKNALLYGDSTAMADAAAMCLHDPIYGLSTNATNFTTTAYLYWDGSFYYQVSLAAPYVKVVPLTTTMPQPPQLNASSGGDLVDWSLALMILALFAIFILLLLQQILGRNFRIIRPLYKCQRWFFDPLHHTFDDMEDDERKGRGTAFSFGEDVIPLSMGGRKPASPPRYRDFDPDHLSRDVELEMTERLRTSLSANALKKSSSNGSGRMGDESFHSYNSDEGDNGGVPLEEKKSRLQDEIPVRLARNPDLVELPHLKSRSKVAVPVSLSEGSVHSTGPPVFKDVI
jgi:hypothetical protein